MDYFCVIPPLSAVADFRQSTRTTITKSSINAFGPSKINIVKDKQMKRIHK